MRKVQISPNHERWERQVRESLVRRGWFNFPGQCRHSQGDAVHVKKQLSRCATDSSGRTRWTVKPQIGFNGVDAPKIPLLLRFVQRITRTEDGIIVDEDTTLRSRLIPVEDYPEFRKAALAADALMQRKIRLVRGVPGS